jgi:hypothetical protein
MGKMIDPPSGWRYGFPKEMPEDLKPEDINEWIVTEGYPKEIIEELGEYFHYRIWEKPDEEINQKSERITWDAAKAPTSIPDEFPALKSLEQHDAERSNQVWNWNSDKPKKNGIACPTCGEELYDSNPMITLTSFPAKKNIHCEKCKYSGYRIA